MAMTSNLHPRVALATGALGLALLSTMDRPYAVAMIQVLHTFGSIANDGSGPLGPPVQGADGNIYGGTAYGGRYAYGTLFKLTTPSSYAVLRSIEPDCCGTGRDNDDDSDGYFPQLLSGADGNIYGTMKAGGGNCCTFTKYGTFFRVTLAGVFTKRFDFYGPPQGPDLAFPGPLVEASDGQLYGTAAFGGAYEDGAVFRIAPTTGLSTWLHVFRRTTEGLSYPSGRLVEHVDGNFYGIAVAGTSHLSTGYSVFRMTPSGSVSTVFTFPANTPRSSLMRSTDGHLYVSIGSTLFRLTLSGTATTLHDFAAGEGILPHLDLLGSDGNFYGTTESGGVGGNGTVFAMNPNGAVVTVYSFPASGVQGAGAKGLLQATDGSFYGTAYSGGTGDGVLFRMVLDSPTISTPLSQSVPTGNAQFSVVAVGDPVPSYQWQLSTTSGASWVDLSDSGVYGGTTTATLAITPASQSMSGHQFRCIASSTTGTVTSGPALLTITGTAPSITQQPTSASVAAYQPVQFHAAAAGVPMPTLQWQHSPNLSSGFSNLAENWYTNGTNSPTLTINPVVANFTGYRYRVVASNLISTATSTAATLTVTAGSGIPDFTLQPSSVTVAPNQPAQFQVVVTAPPVTYLTWQVSTTAGATWSNVPELPPYSGSDTRTLTIAAAPAGLNGARYRVVASNYLGTATSDPAVLTVSGTGTSPSITQQPTSMSVAASQPVQFRAAAAGVPTPTLQWQVSTDAGTSYSDVSAVAPYSGTTSPTLAIAAAPAGLNGARYRIVASSHLGVATSNSALLTVSVTPGAVEPPSAFRIDSVVGNQVRLRWDAPASGPPPTGYVVEGGTRPGETLGALPVGALPLLTFAAPNGSFYVRVKSIDGTMASGPSNEVLLHVNSAVAPSSPASLTGLANGASLDLAWKNTFAGGSPSGTVLNVTGAIVGSVPLGLVESFSFPGVPAGTYTLSVSAVNGTGVSAPSIPVTLTFPAACSGPPNVPANYVFYKNGSTVYLLWDPPASGPAPTSYSLNVVGTYAGDVPTTARSLSATVPPGSYSIRVFALNACGSSAPTSAQTVSVP